MLYTFTVFSLKRERSVQIPVQDMTGSSITNHKKKIALELNSVKMQKHSPLEIFRLGIYKPLTVYMYIAIYTCIPIEGSIDTGSISGFADVLTVHCQNCHTDKQVKGEVQVDHRATCTHLTFCGQQ